METFGDSIDFFKFIKQYFLDSTKKKLMMSTNIQQFLKTQLKKINVPKKIGYSNNFMIVDVLAKNIFFGFSGSPIFFPIKLVKMYHSTTKTDNQQKETLNNYELVLNLYEKLILKRIEDKKYSLIFQMNSEKKIFENLSKIY
jgi:hypothetical protein